MFKRVLIANRGEIALRIIRACRDLGIETVAVYSEADSDTLALRYADEIVKIGPAPSGESYLNIPRIISAAEVTDVDAIHPGYGFLAENAHFAEICRASNIEFIGPSVEAMKAVGDKITSKQLARDNDVPTVPGSDDLVRSAEEALALAQKIGFPVIIKATAGGGGRGMRVAHNANSLVNGFHSAQAEAENAFKNPGVYIEKYIEKFRHIEIQVLGDEYGNIIHLGERDCTCQRRHQKLIEEAPSPALDDDLRRRIGEASVRFARAANYYSAGTVEYILDPKGNFYLMEMNARIQVEHPVTEMVTGVDLVKEQIKIASGQKLKLKQEDVKIGGHAIEVRINAEDPHNGFMPSPGRIGMYVPPVGRSVRIDTHIYSGYNVSPYYDSMLAKLIVHEPTRRQTIKSMRRALEDYIIEGPKTTIPLHLEVMRNHQFLSSDFDNDFINRLLNT